MTEPMTEPIAVPTAASSPTSAAIDPRGRCLTIAKLWLDGRLAQAREATLDVEASGVSWRVSARLADRDPFARSYGLSLQLEDGRVLHGHVRLVAAGDGRVVFEGSDAPEGGWI